MTNLFDVLRVVTAAGLVLVGLACALVGDYSRATFDLLLAILLYAARV